MIRTIVIAFSLLITLCLVGCNRPLTRGESGALIGGAVGAGVGAAVGRGPGALIGGGAGALVGSAIARRSY